MDRDRDRDRGRQIKRPKTSTSSDSSSSRQHARDRDSNPVEEKPVAHHHEEEKPFPINKKELYEKITAYELEEAMSMDLSKTLETYASVLANLEENIAEVFSSKHGEGLSEERKDLLKMEGINYISSLKSINRLLKYRLKFVKDEQLAKRAQVDAEHLKLQNLLYEATNLQNQVAAVQDYKSMDEKIDLIPVERFYKDAPESISKPETTRKDPHLLRIARLEYEFIQRQKLTEQCSVLEKEKEVINKNIEERQTKLDSIGPLLKKVLDSTVPLQEFFSLDISSKKARNDVARFLPSPLFVLFVQSDAYQDSPEGKRIFSVKISGDVEAAKDLLAEEEHEIEEEDDSDRNLEPDAEQVSERRLLRKRTSIGLSLDESRKRTFQTHPLWIEWNVKGKGNESVTVNFYYLTKLKIVTVTSRVHRDSSDGTTSTTYSDAVLNELYPNDCGTESPNPANVFILNKLELTAINSYLKDVGKPYFWAQRVSGIEFPVQAKPGQDFEVRAKMEVSTKNIEGTVRKIRRRLINQSKLWTQLKGLEAKLTIIPPAAKELLPQKNSTNFVSWESITFETYSSQAFTAPLISCGATSVKDTFFKATLQRGTAKIIALVAVKLEFPNVEPVFCIQLDKAGNLRNAKTDVAIRAVEEELNCHVPKDYSEWPESLISIQLFKLMACCDIILESDSVQDESEGPSEFSREKLLLSIAKGRNLRRPFQYVNQGGGYFTQRY